jgi:hypothetical protein
MRQLKPPETLEREQADAALRAIPDHRHGLRGEAIHLPPGEVAKLEAIWKDRAGEIGVPPEALTDTTLFWAYVLKKRQEYAFELSLYNRFTNGGDFRIRYLLEGSAVDTNLVTRPLTDVQLRAAKAWKIAYLQRLRHEKVDESYIDAYLKAWNLSPAAVFPEDRR